MLGESTTRDREWTHGWARVGHPLPTSPTCFEKFTIYSMDIVPKPTEPAKRECRRHCTGLSVDLSDPPHSLRTRCWGEPDAGVHSQY